MSISKAIREKKKKLSDIDPENALEEHMKDPIDKLVESYGDEVDLDKNMPDESSAENEEKIKDPINFALKMKKARIAKMMMKAK